MSDIERGNLETGNSNSGFLGTRRLLSGSLILSAALLSVFPLFAWFGYAKSGPAGVIAAAVAGGICWFASLLALVVMGFSRDSTATVAATLFSMLVRFGVPLMGGLMLQQMHGELARAGVFGMILCYYFVALIVETVLSMQLIRTKSPSVVKA